MEFRKLRADEIDCRVGTIKASGCTLLLYKDARCDMNILDETVGAENWQRQHEVINGNLFCSVWINVLRDDGIHEWVWKQDVGVESNTEKEKGEASDSFKRACVNWGIGRELYTAPFIYIPADKVTIETMNNGKCFLKDKLIVKEIEYNENGRISALVIFNVTRNADAYSWYEKPKKASGKSKATPKTADDKLSEDTLAQLSQVLDANGIQTETIMYLYKVKNLSELTQKKAENILNYIPDVVFFQRKCELSALIKSKGFTEEYICGIFGKENLKELSRDEVEQAFADIRNGG